MNCKNCSGLHWHPNKGFYCTIPNCNPDTTKDDLREIIKYVNNNDNSKEKYINGKKIDFERGIIK